MTTEGSILQPLKPEDYLEELTVTNPFNNKCQKLGTAIKDIMPMVVERVVEYNKPGDFSLNFKVTKGDKNEIIVKTEVKHKLPTGKDEVVLYLSHRNNIYKHNPEQLRMAIDNVEPIEGKKARN